MLNYFSKSKHNIFVKIIFLLIAVSFLLAGTSALFNKNSEQAILYINEEPILLNKYQDEYNKNINILKSINRKDIDTKDFGNIILKVLINRFLILQEAKKLGLEISDESISELTRKRFINEESKVFDRAFFEQFLKYNGVTESEYIRELREDMLIKQVTNLITKSLVEVPRSLVELEYIKDNIDYNIKYLILDNSDIKKNNKKEFTKRLKSTDKEILDYYNKNKDELFSEQKLNISLIKIEKGKKTDIEFYDLIKSIENQIISGLSIQQISKEININHESKEILYKNLNQLIKEESPKINESEINIFSGSESYSKVILQIDKIYPKKHIEISRVKDKINQNILEEKSHIIAKEIIKENKDKIIKVMQKNGSIWNSKTIKTEVNKNSKDSISFDITQIHNMKKNDNIILSDDENKKHIFIILNSLKAPKKINEKDLPYYTKVVKSRIADELQNRFIFRLINNAKIEYNKNIMSKLNLEIK